MTAASPAHGHPRLRENNSLERAESPLAKGFSRFRTRLRDTPTSGCNFEVWRRSTGVHKRHVTSSMGGSIARRRTRLESGNGASPTRDPLRSPVSAGGRVVPIVAVVAMKPRIFSHDGVVDASFGVWESLGCHGSGIPLTRPERARRSGGPLGRSMGAPRDPASVSARAPGTVVPEP